MMRAAHVADGSLALIFATGCFPSTTCATFSRLPTHGSLDRVAGLADRLPGTSGSRPTGRGDRVGRVGVGPTLVAARAIDGRHMGAGQPEPRLHLGPVV